MEAAASPGREETPEMVFELPQALEGEGVSRVMLQNLWPRDYETLASVSSDLLP